MKTYLVYFLLLTIIFSCSENSSQPQDSATVKKSEIVKESGKKLPEVDALEKLLKMSGVDPEVANSNVDAFEELLKVGEGDSQKSGKSNSLEDMLTTPAILDLLEQSGVSRNEMEKLINNPDSLKMLAQKAIKDREANRFEKKESRSKKKLSEKQLTSKNTPTGVSIQEAILIVQAESGPDATMAKLKKIDSLAGTNLMEKIDLTEASSLMRSVERKNEIQASPEEEEEMKMLKKRSSQIHSDKEAKQLFIELEKMEKDIASGALKVSPKYQRTIEYQKKKVKIYDRDFARKAKGAKKRFRQLNPDLYFGDEVGTTYMGHMRKLVYLPLGKLSFADKVVNVNHPKLLTQQVKNVLGEPDVIMSYIPEDIIGIHSLGLGGDLTIRFEDNALTNVNGPDLYIFEIGQIEPTNLEISKDGKKWIKVGKIDGGVAQVDIEEFVKQGELFYYVRLKDLKTHSGLPGADVDAIAAIGSAMRLNLDSEVLFDSGKSVLKSEGKEALKELANSIQVLKSGTVIVEGHTDDVGSKNTNQKLSLARAKSVSTELKKLIPSSTFKWKEKGLGESKPLVENNSDINRSKNRRVEVLVLPN